MPPVHVTGEGVKMTGVSPQDWIQVNVKITPTPPQKYI